MSEKMPPGLASRIAVSTAVGIGWLVFLILFFAFYADRYSVYQNLAIFLASVLVVAVILGPMWVYWGIKIGPRYIERWERNAERWERRFERKRVRRKRKR